MLSRENYEGVLTEGVAQREEAVLAEFARSKAMGPGAPAAAQDVDFHAATLPSTKWLGWPADNRRRGCLAHQHPSGKGRRFCP